MYNKYVIFFHEDGKYKMIQYIGSFMDDHLAKIVICHNYLKMKYQRDNRLELEDRFIDTNKVTFKNKEYEYGKFIRKRRMPKL